MQPGLDGSREEGSIPWRAVGYDGFLLPSNVGNAINPMDISGHDGILQPLTGNSVKVYHSQT